VVATKQCIRGRIWMIIGGGEIYSSVSHCLREKRHGDLWLLRSSVFASGPGVKC